MRDQGLFYRPLHDDELFYEPLNGYYSTEKIIADLHKRILSLEEKCEKHRSQLDGLLGYDDANAKEQKRENI